MINSTAYYNDFWNEMRGKQAVTDSLYNNRESKTNEYHLPGESNKKYTAVLQKESAVRQLATVVNATRSDSRLWTFDCEGQAEWGDMVNLEGMDNEDDFQRFEVQAYRLSELRKQRGLSQELLAERTGINVNTIRKYEIGIRKPKVEQLKKIADGLEISVIEFLDIEIENEADLIAMLKKISPFFKWDGLLHVLVGEKFL